MGYRKTVRRRLWLVLLATVLCVGSSALLLIGVARHKETDRNGALLNQARPNITGYIARMRQEIGTLDSGAAGASTARLNEWISECDEDMVIFRKASRHVLEDDSVYEEMEEEWEEIVTRSESIRETEQQTDRLRGSLQQLQVDLDAFENHYRGTYGTVTATIAARGDMARRWIYGGGAGSLLAGFCCAVLLLSGIADIASESFDRAELDEELSNVAQTPQFVARINLLRGGAAPLGQDARWELSLAGSVSERRTHLSFEALARCGEERIALWGRRYKWAGYLKSFQRVLFPAFENAYWQGICVLHANGLPGPVPVVHSRFPKAPFGSGGMLLMGHLGKLQSLKEFIKSEFCLFAPAAQQKLMEHLVEFLHNLHSAGLHRISLRYIHASNLQDPDGGLQLYLLDLDKVLLWPRCPRFVASLLRRMDFRRIQRDLQPYLSSSALSDLRRQFEELSLRTSQRAGA